MDNIIDKTYLVVFSHSHCNNLVISCNACLSSGDRSSPLSNCSKDSSVPVFEWSILSIGSIVLLPELLLASSKETEFPETILPVDSIIPVDWLPVDIVDWGLLLNDPKQPDNNKTQITNILVERYFICNKYKEIKKQDKELYTIM